MKILEALLVLILVSGTFQQFKIVPPGESDQQVTNPDQGFYRPLTVVITPNSFTTDSFDTPDAIYHLRTDISAFSKAVNGEADKELTSKALDGIDDLLSKIRGQGKNAIIRFVYDPGYAGNSDTECGMSMIQTHVKQLSKILNNYPDVLTAIEAGMVGRWGEMHSTKIVTLPNVQTLIDCWLDNVTKVSGIPILVRYPYFLYYFCDEKTKIGEVSDIVFKPTDRGYLLGMFNDGMYGDITDLGTWKQDRVKEMTWVAKQNAHLPYGGETAFEDDYDGLYIHQSIPEMFMNHLSFLNLYWTPAIYDRWKKEKYDDSIAGHSVFNGKTGYDFVYAHFGYRLVISDIKVTINGNKFDVTINIDNNGFGYVNKLKKVGLAFSYDGRKVVDEQNDLAEYIGNQDQIKLSGEFIDDPSDDYSVYLRMYYAVENGAVKYPVRFANKEIYNDNINGNLLFKVSQGNDNIYEP